MADEKSIKDEFNGEYPEFFETNVAVALFGEHKKLIANKISDNCYQIEEVDSGWLLNARAVLAKKDGKPLPGYQTFEDAVWALLKWEQDHVRRTAGLSSDYHYTKYIEVVDINPMDAVRPPSPK